MPPRAKVAASPSASTTIEQKTVLNDLRGVLGKHKSQIQEWKGYLDKVSQRKDQLDLIRRKENLAMEDLTNDLEDRHEQHLRGLAMLQTPEKRAAGIINDIVEQSVRMKGGVQKTLRGEDNDDDEVSKRRPWQKTGPTAGHRSLEAEALESLLHEIHDAAEELSLRIAKEPPSLSGSFVDDIQALIRQNVVLKLEAEKCALELLQLQDEVSKLREDAKKNQTTHNSLNQRLQEVSAERNELSEKLRHGMAAQEKDEYAREIQNLAKSKRSFLKKFGDMTDTIDKQDKRIDSLEKEIERLKRVNILQEEQFKETVGRLVRDKKSLQSVNHQMHRHMSQARTNQWRAQSQAGFGDFTTSKDPASMMTRKTNLDNKEDGVNEASSVRKSTRLGAASRKTTQVDLSPSDL